MNNEKWQTFCKIIIVYDSLANFVKKKIKKFLQGVEGGQWDWVHNLEQELASLLDGEICM
jgi:hypothetical protein